MSLSLTLDLDEAMIAKLMQVPLHLRLAPSERVLKAMAKPIIEKAKYIAPSSRKSGTRNKWSEKYKSNAAYQNDSGQSLGMVYRKTESGGYLMVGGKHPQANKQNYDSGKDRTIKLWGRNPVKYPITNKRVDPKDRFMQRAFDETRDAQLSAGFKQLETEIKELKIG
jgi:hypothetical protein